MLELYQFFNPGTERYRPSPQIVAEDFHFVHPMDLIAGR
jgi:hypothetical protein